MNQSSAANIAIQETNELDEPTKLPQIASRIFNETPATKDAAHENFAFQTQAQQAFAGDLQLEAARRSNASKHSIGGGATRYRSNLKELPSLERQLYSTKHFATPKAMMQSSRFLQRYKQNQDQLLREMDHQFKEHYAKKIGEPKQAISGTGRPDFGAMGVSPGEEMQYEQNISSYSSMPRRGVRKSRPAPHKNHFAKRDFSPQTVRLFMIKNLQAQVVPLVVYQDKETKKTVATVHENITKKFPDPDPLAGIDSLVIDEPLEPTESSASTNKNAFLKKRSSVASINQQLDQKARQNADKSYFIKSTVPQDRLSPAARRLLG